MLPGCDILAFMNPLSGASCVCNAGIGFFYGATWGISCYHTFDSPKPKLGQQWTAQRVSRNGRQRKLELVFTNVNKPLDYVCFSTTSPQQYLPLLTDLSSQLRSGREFALCSYWLQLRKSEVKEFDISFAPLTVRLGPLDIAMQGTAQSLSRDALAS